MYVYCTHKKPTRTEKFAISFHWEFFFRWTVNEIDTSFFYSTDHRHSPSIDILFSIKPDSWVLFEAILLNLMKKAFVVLNLHATFNGKIIKKCALVACLHEKLWSIFVFRDGNRLTGKWRNDQHFDTQTCNRRLIRVFVMLFSFENDLRLETKIESHIFPSHRIFHFSKSEFSSHQNKSLVLSMIERYNSTW